MSLAPAEVYATAVLEAAEDILATHADYALLIAQANTARSSDPLLVQVPARAIEMAPVAWDDEAMPQSYPAIRLDILDTEDFTGVNNSVQNSRHALEVRSFHITVGNLATSLASGKRTIATTAMIRARQEARAIRFLLEQHMTSYAVDGVPSGIFDIQPISSGIIDRMASGAGILLRVSQTFDVWQRSRSGRFDSPRT